jgi:hypothetical protein
MESIPPAYVAQRAGTITLFYLVPGPHRWFKNSSTTLKRVNDHHLAWVSAWGEDLKLVTTRTVVGATSRSDQLVVFVGGGGGEGERGQNNKPFSGPIM